MRILLILIVMTSLAGCATTAERAARAKREATQMIAIYGPACEKLGYKAGTDPWRDCILRLDARDNGQRTYPTMTNCIGGGGLLQCTSF